MIDIQEKYQFKVALGYGKDGAHKSVIESEKRMGGYVFVQYHHINPYKPYYMKEPERMAIFKEKEDGKLECVRGGIYVGDMYRITIVDEKIHIINLAHKEEKAQVIDPSEKERRFFII